MGYYIRVLAEKPDLVTVPELRDRLEAEGLDVDLVVDGDEDAWEQIILQHVDGDPIAQVERNPVEPGTLGQEEIEEFREALQEALPRSAAEWLMHYLPTVKVIYAFQVLEGTEQDPGWKAIWALQHELQSRLGGSFQSDGEGFTNQQGFHILWQFTDDAAGPWKMAVLDEAGRWQAFEMDLDNLVHRQAFLEGKVPGGVRFF